MINTYLQNLLSQITLINQKYENIFHVTGDNFNVFKILQIEYSEVGLHSLFISELLNPKGSHNLKDIFFKLFIECIIKNKLHNDKDFSVFNKRIEDVSRKFNSANYDVITEEPFIHAFEDKTISGRIDIVLKNNVGDAIIIENKIHAKDQNKQLLRYYKRYPEKPILYLTLYGEQPKDSSISEDKTSDEKLKLQEGKDFMCISYNQDILNWLELCIKEAYSYPLLRETLKQYMSLIKNITNQNTNLIMENDIIKVILSSSQNIDAALMIGESISPIKDEILKSILNELEIKFREKNQFSLNIEIETKGIKLWKDNWKFYIYAYYSPSEAEKFFLGFVSKEEYVSFEDIKEAMIVLLKKFGKTKDYSNSKEPWIYCELKIWNDSTWSERYSLFTEKFFETIIDICKTLEGVKIDLNK